MIWACGHKSREHVASAVCRWCVCSCKLPHILVSLIYSPILPSSCGCEGGRVCSLTRDAIQQHSFVFYCRPKETSKFRWRSFLSILFSLIRQKIHILFMISGFLIEERTENVWLQLVIILIMINVVVLIWSGCQHHLGRCGPVTGFAPPRTFDISLRNHGKTCPLIIQDFWFSLFLLLYFEHLGVPFNWEIGAKRILLLRLLPSVVWGKLFALVD